MTVHTWDLAVATGQQHNWDADVVVASIEASRRAFPDGDREAAFEALRPNLPPGTNPPFANPVTVADGAPAIDRLIGWYGRQPVSRV